MYLPLTKGVVEGNERSYYMESARTKACPQRELSECLVPTVIIMSPKPAMGLALEKVLY